MKKIYVIGIGYKSLDEKEREIVLNSPFILASSRLFEVFRRYKEFEDVRERVLVIDSVDEAVNFINSLFVTYHPSLNIAVLASGDPLFFGIGRRLLNEFGKEIVEIMPDLSSIQVAFARIKEPWDDACLMSLYRGPEPQKRRKPKYEIKDVPVLFEKHRKLAILTDEENNPSEIAKALISLPLTHNLSAMMFVCEKLGYPDERITEGTPEVIKDSSFSTPNVVIILAGTEGDR